MQILLRKALLPCLVAALALACGGSSSDSQAPSQPGTGSGPKLAWDQFAPSAEELRQYSYVLYVDGTAVPLSGATCGTLAADTLTAACSAPLPALSPGQHTLAMATRITRDGVVLESSRSEPITYSAGGTATASFTLGAQAEGGAAGGVDGGVDRPPSEGSVAPTDRPYVIEAVVTGLDCPSALAQLPDGRLVIAERGGRLRIADGGALLAEPAGLLPDADPGVDAVVSLALAPDFGASRHVYVGYAALGAQGSRSGRVMRFREAGGALGEPAIILDGLPAASAAPWVAIGPDQALYVGTSAADAGEAADLGSYAGKILRFSLDGTTPADNPRAASPIYSFGYRGLSGIGWDGLAGTSWALEADNEGAGLTRVAAGRQGTPVVALGQAGPARMAFLAADAAGAPVEWRGSLFVAAPAQQCLVRVGGLSASRPAPAVERLFQGQIGRIALVLAADDGLYFATANGAEGAAGASVEETRAADAVYRVRERTGSSLRRRESP